MKIGYQRVSTVDQNLDRQELEGCYKIFADKISGATRERPALGELIQFARSGDEVVIHSIDRLARDLRDLQDIIQKLTDKGVSVSFIKERLVFSGDADDAFGKFQLQMMGAFAEFERNIIRQRQAEGIAKAKQRGVYKGRKKKTDDNRIRKMKSEGHGATEIAETLGVSRMTVYRALR
ncbi:MAG: recombinase family protein [Sulfitobacter sp.]|nr:recombinase family protein [Sulfitobacter sp.]